MALDLRLYTSTVRVTDGVYGTQLHQSGLLTAGGCEELLNSANPAAVEAVARSYVEAGADVIMTNSLKAHRFGLAPYGEAGRAAELAGAAAKIASKAAEGTAAGRSTYKRYERQWVKAE